MRLVIDCNYLCYRSLYTMAGLTHEEKQVGVIFGFIKQILKLSSQFQTSKFVFCWDSKQSYRKLIYPEYKAGRHKDLTDEQQMDLEMAFGQFDELRENFLPYMGFKNIFHQIGYEADDLIAHVVMRHPDDTLIVSADNDLFQLLLDNRFCPVKMWNFKVVNSEARFTADWFGLKPVDWIKVKSLAGCSSDNIAGIDGVGELTAAKYVAEILQGKKRQIIEDWIDNSKDQMDLNYRLIALPFVGKKPLRIEYAELDDISPVKFRAIFGQYGFRSLIAVDEMARWMDSFFGGDHGGKSGPNVIRKIQR